MAGSGSDVAQEREAAPLVAPGSARGPGCREEAGRSWSPFGVWVSEVPACNSAVPEGLTLKQLPGEGGAVPLRLFASSVFMAALRSAEAGSAAGRTPQVCSGPGCPGRDTELGSGLCLSLWLGKS